MGSRPAVCQRRPAAETGRHGPEGGGHNPRQARPAAELLLPSYRCRPKPLRADQLQHLDYEELELLRRLKVPGQRHGTTMKSMHFRSRIGC
jgi:hypothetical protein